MIISDEIAFKKRLMSHCLALLRERISIAQEAMNEAQSAANNEEKSSAGDKYETGRAMNHLNKDMHARQLSANNEELLALSNIDAGKQLHTPSPGALITCGDLLFFIAAGLGKLKFENRIVYVVAPAAPVAKKFQTLKIGDNMEFNNSTLTITSII